MKTFSALDLAWNIVLSDNAEITLGLYPMKDVVRQKLTTGIPLRQDNWINHKTQNIPHLS